MYSRFVAVEKSPCGAVPGGSDEIRQRQRFDNPARRDRKAFDSIVRPFSDR
jgi:hypothetical protein